MTYISHTLLRIDLITEFDSAEIVLNAIFHRSFHQRNHHVKPWNFLFKLSTVYAFLNIFKSLTSFSQSFVNEFTLLCYHYFGLV